MRGRPARTWSMLIDGYWVTFDRYGILTVTEA